MANIEGKSKSEYYSDNSASLPGIINSSGPAVFEPGMFNKKDSDETKSKGETINKVEYNKKHFFYFILNLNLSLQKLF